MFVGDFDTAATTLVGLSPVIGMTPWSGVPPEKQEAVHANVAIAKTHVIREIIAPLPWVAVNQR
jgi:hypothetical protein